jgi:hypothetical protein
MGMDGFPGRSNAHRIQIAAIVRRRAAASGAADNPAGFSGESGLSNFAGVVRRDQEHAKTPCPFQQFPPHRHEDP